MSKYIPIAQACAPQTGCDQNGGPPETALRRGVKQAKHELADNRTAAVGEHHRAASFDNGRRLRSHDISAEISSRAEIPIKANMSAPARPTTAILRWVVRLAVCIDQFIPSTKSPRMLAGTLYFRTMNPIPKYKAPASNWAQIQSDDLKRGRVLSNQPAREFSPSRHCRLQNQPAFVRHRNNSGQVRAVGSDQAANDLKRTFGPNRPYEADKPH